MKLLYLCRNTALSDRYLVKNKDRDSIWIQRPRLPGDKFKGVQIFFEVWGGKSELKGIRRFIAEINKMEEMASHEED